MDIAQARRRIYEWAVASPNLADKVAVDTLFAELNRLRGVDREMAQMRYELIGDEPDE